MKPDLPFSYIRSWLDSRKRTFDAEQDVIDKVKTDRRLYVNFPSRFPHKAYLYKLVRDRLGMTDRQHLDAVNALFVEYQRFVNDAQTRAANETGEWLRKRRGASTSDLTPAARRGRLPVSG